MPRFNVRIKIYRGRRLTKKPFRAAVKSRRRLMGLSYPVTTRRPRCSWFLDQNSSDRKILIFIFKHNPQHNSKPSFTHYVLICYRCGKRRENHEHSLVIEVSSGVSLRILGDGESWRWERTPTIVWIVLMQATPAWHNWRRSSFGWTARNACSSERLHFSRPSRKNLS